jgi:hypothetical protein
LIDAGRLLKANNGRSRIWRTLSLESTFPRTSWMLQRISSSKENLVDQLP